MIHYIAGLSPADIGISEPTVGESAPRAERIAGVRAFVDEGIAKVLGAVRDCAAGEPLIVVTGDHGYRSRDEHPSIRSGWLDEVRFRVDLLMHHRGLFEEPLVVDHPTSHTDLTPTILDLLGRLPPAGLYAGRSIVGPVDPGRLVFLPSWFARSAVALWRDRAFLFEEKTDQVFRAASPVFTYEDLIDPDDEEAQALKKSVDLYEQARLSLPALLDTPEL